MININFSRIIRLINERPKLTIVVVFTLATTILFGHFWFFSPYKLQLVYQNWDGPAYVIIAKSFYRPTTINQVNTLPLGEGYYAAHFPLYPIAIRMVSFIGYFRAMIFSSLMFSMLFVLSFYKLSRLIYPKVNALYLSLALIFLTPRWFVVSHVGGSEPLFLFLVTLVLINLKRRRFLLAAIFAALAQITRIQGAFVFVGLGSYYLFSLVTKKTTLKQAVNEFLPFVLVPLSLLTVFTLYYYQYGDFFAFFKAQSSYQHLYWPPFRVFDLLNSNWANVWKESYVFNYLLYLSAIIILFREKLYQFAFIATAFFIPLILEVHVDISRYLLVLLPFLFLAYSRLITSKVFRLTLVLIIPAIYAFAINYISINISP